MAELILKFVNQMIFQAEQVDENKAAKFIGKLECLGIYDLFQDWGKKDNEDINNQIYAFQLTANKITANPEYQIEVYKTKNKELELHKAKLEKKVEDFREQ